MKDTSAPATTTGAMTAPPLDGLPPVPTTASLPADVRLRRPLTGDYNVLLDAVHDWWGGLYNAAGNQQRMGLFPRLFLEHFNDTCLVAENEEGGLVAFLIGFLSHSQPHIGYIHLVAVNPERRGEGLASSLYRIFSDQVAALGATELNAVTGPANKVSIAYHTRIGFAIELGDAMIDGIPVHLDHDGPGRDRVYFRRPVFPRPDGAA